MTHAPSSSPLPSSDPGAPPASGAIPRLRLIRTTDVEEARRAFSDLYAEAIFEPTRGRPFGCQLDVALCGSVNVVAGTWAGGGRAIVPSLGDRYMMSLSDGGVGGGAHAGERFVFDPGRRAGLFSPSRALTLDVGPDFRGRTIVIERGALDAHLFALTGHVARAPLVFDAALHFETGAGATLLGIVQLFRREVERPDASPFMITSLRDALFTALLTCAPHGASWLFERSPSRPSPGSVRRAEEYISAHAGEPITLTDIVAAAGVPARSLRAAFTQHRGVSPMEFLRQRRFELARQRLIGAAPGTTVASVIEALGLGSAGRFSGAYRKRFGESPAETLARGRADPRSSGPRR